MTVTELSGCAIIEDDKLLLIWKIKHGHYEFPGGKVEEGESYEETAIREVKEEIGVDVDLTKYAGYNEFHIDGRNFISHKFLAKIKKGQVLRIAEPDIFKDIIWLPIKDYKKYSVAPNVKDFCEDYIHGKLKHR